MRLLNIDKRDFIRLICVFSILTSSSLVLAQENAQAVSIYDVQFTENASGESPYVGQEVAISGVVVAAFADGYVMAEASGPWKAIFVYSIANGPDIGDEVEVTGTIAEYSEMTEVIDVTGYQHLSSGNSVDSVLLSVGEASQEQYESVLITVESISVAELLSYGEWTVSDGNEFLICDDKNDYTYFPRLGDSLDSVTGVVFYSYGQFKLEPRATYDITGSLIPHYALNGHIVTMNETRDVLSDAYLEILGDEIVTIDSNRPSDIPVVESGGLIFPGLIDSHNHPAYNVLDVIPFETQFAERYEWQTDPLYTAFKDQLASITDYGGPDAQRINILKLAEVRALTAGTTSIQGLNCNGHSHDSFAHQGIVINNVERFPARVYSSTFPLRQGLVFWARKSAEYWDRVLIHLSEGTSRAALEEFISLQSTGMLNSRTTIIHGVPYGPWEWTAMAEAGASLIWSPTSNLRLYGQTANIPEALAAGVNVALSPDWTESGSKTILDELREASRLNTEAWESIITPLQLAEFVTCNAAKAAGIEEIVGQIAPGFRANLVVIPGDPNAPYDALLTTDTAAVKLTVVDGRPMYGNPDILAEFGFIDNVETVHIGDEEKSLAIQIESHVIPDANKPFLEILAELEDAYLASEPKICEFVGIN